MTGTLLTRIFTHFPNLVTLAVDKCELDDVEVLECAKHLKNFLVFDCNIMQHFRLGTFNKCNIFIHTPTMYYTNYFYIDDPNFINTRDYFTNLHQQ